MNLKQRNVVTTHLNRSSLWFVLYHVVSSFHFSIFDISLPGGGSFAKEFHETTLHHQPEASRHVKDDG